MSCSPPICYLLQFTRADGSSGLLMAADLPTALADVAGGEGWTDVRVMLGRETVLEGEALRRAVAERLGG
jgi:hypothetical protein